MQVLADEYESSMRINSYNPGATRTAMRAQAFPAEDPMTLKTPRDRVNDYLWLLSDSNMSTGKAYDFMNDLINSLKNGVVTISFKKIDTGEIRVMPSTLNPKLIPMGSIINNISEDSETIMVWSLDKNSWRDIRVNTILEWNVEG